MAALFTEKMEAFCLKVIELDSPKYAYKATYNTSGNDSTIETEANRLMKNPLVVARIQELRNMSAEVHFITQEGQARKLEKVFEGAMKDGRYDAANNAIMGQSKHYGLIIEKAELSGKNGGAIPFTQIIIEPVSPK